MRLESVLQDDTVVIMQAQTLKLFGRELLMPSFHFMHRLMRMALAGFGLHAALAVGRRRPVSTAAHWADQLATFSVKLRCDGELVAKGRGSDVLGSPLTALRHLNDLLADPAFGAPLTEGEIITTGTLTLAMPVSPGETWTAEPMGIDLEAISVRTA